MVKFHTKSKTYQKFNLCVDSAASSAETFRLKLSALGAEASAETAARAGVGPEGAAGRAGAGVVGAYARGAGGQRARAHLAAARAPDHWHHALPLLAYHIAHQLYPLSY